MRLFGHLLEVFVHDLHLGLVPGGTEFTGNQRFAQFLLAANVDPAPVVEGSVPSSRSKALLQNGIVDQAQLRDLVHLQTHGDARVRKGVHKVHGAVHGINDPGGLIGQLLDTLRAATLLLADEPATRKVEKQAGKSARILLVLRKVATNAVHQQLLHILVCLGHQVDVIALANEVLSLLIVASDELGKLPGKRKLP